MGKYEVTNAQYRRFKADHDSQAYEGKSLNGDAQPAVYVSWDEAQYCWLGFIRDVPLNRLHNLLKLKEERHSVQLQNKLS